MKAKLISIIVPVYNEAANLPILYKDVTSHTHDLKYNFEFSFVDDGSRDNSSEVLSKMVAKHKNIRFIQLSRNFGKEAAVSAGLHSAKGQAAIILDADLQHPPKLIPKFIKKWEKGADVVVGVKRYSKKESSVKRASSSLFYKVLGAISHTEITPHASDYRLLDRRVIKAFRSFSERNRMTRGLIDWLGFKRDYVYFETAPRRYGKRSYSYRKLFTLAVDNFTSYSFVPLKLAGYLGVAILIISGVFGIFVYIEQILMNDPMGLSLTGTAMLAILVLFMIGVVLACLGLISLYIASIHAEVTNRPLYVVRDFMEAEASEEGS